MSTSPAHAALPKMPCCNKLTGEGVYPCLGHAIIRPSQINRQIIKLTGMSGTRALTPASLPPLTGCGCPPVTNAGCWR